MKDTQAIIEANRLLDDPKATARDLQSALDALQAERSEHRATRPEDPSTSTSLAQRGEREQRMDDYQKVEGVYSRLQVALHSRLQQARQAEAVANADDDRAALVEALEAAEAAQDEADRLALLALNAARHVAAQKQAAGHRGKVGASRRIIDRLLGLHGTRHDPSAHQLRAHAVVGE